MFELQVIAVEGIYDMFRNSHRSHLLVVGPVLKGYLMVESSSLGLLLFLVLGFHLWWLLDTLSNLSASPEGEGGEWEMEGNGTYIRLIFLYPMYTIYNCSWNYDRTP
jgi:hypothetical protein